MSSTIKAKRSRLSAKPWTPHEYQKRAVKWLVQRESAALFLEPGLGKTSIALMAFLLLKEAKKAKKALVIAPLRVAYSVWPVEVREWKDFQDIRVGVFHGKARDKFDFSAYDIVVINPEGVEGLVYGKQNKLDMKRWTEYGFDTLIVDELSKFKNPSSQRFKLMKKVLGTFTRRWGLTGTPVANGLMDLFGQMYMIDSGKSLGEFITHFRINYFYQAANNPWKWIPGKKSEDRIYARIADVALSMSADDYLTLPPLVDVFHELELPPGARKIYDSLEKDLVAEIEEGAIVASNAAAATTKLRQLCNGGVWDTNDDGDRVVREVHTVKTEWLKDLVEELQGAPLLVVYEFKHDLTRLRKAFPKLENIGGGTTPGAAMDIVERWNKNEIPVLAVHPKSAGHGLNMQKGAAAHIAFYSMTWDFELYDQVSRRIFRQGTSAARVFRYHAIMKDSVDEDMKWALKRKTTGHVTLFASLMDRGRN